MLTPPKILKLKGRSPLLDGGGDAQEAAWADISTPAPQRRRVGAARLVARAARPPLRPPQQQSRQRGPLARNLAAFDARVDLVQLESYIEEIEKVAARDDEPGGAPGGAAPGSELPVWGVELTNAQGGAARAAAARGGVDRSIAAVGVGG